MHSRRTSRLSDTKQLVITNLHGVQKNCVGSPLPGWLNQEVNIPNFSTKLYHFGSLFLLSNCMIDQLRNDFELACTISSRIAPCKLNQSPIRRKISAKCDYLDGPRGGGCQPTPRSWAPPWRRVRWARHCRCFGERGFSGHMDPPTPIYYIKEANQVNDPVVFLALELFSLAFWCLQRVLVYSN